MGVRLSDTNLTKCKRGNAEWDHMILFKCGEGIFVCWYFPKNASCIPLACPGSVVTPYQRDLTLPIVYLWNNSEFWYLCRITTLLSENKTVVVDRIHLPVYLSAAGNVSQLRQHAFTLLLLTLSGSAAPTAHFSPGESHISYTSLLPKLASVNLQCENVAVQANKAARLAPWKSQGDYFPTAP